MAHELAEEKSAEEELIKKTSVDTELSNAMRTGEGACQGEEEEPEHDSEVDDFTPEDDAEYHRSAAPAQRDRQPQ